MKRCGVNLARDLFGKGESEQELLRGGEHTGPIFGLFYPSAKASVKWMEGSCTSDRGPHAPFAF
eukprot:14735310-Alexandrium_andersonii.AAC.1